MNGVALGSPYELISGRSVTAHVWGGGPVGQEAKQSVVGHAVKGQGSDHVYVCVGSLIPAKQSVNSALTI